MNYNNLFPTYIPRYAEEKLIKSFILKVQEDSVSRVLLLYGNGGVGKSYLLRNLPQSLAKDEKDERMKNVVYVGPIDVDDAEYWSTTNLNRFVADQISHDEFFENYREFLVKMPEVEHKKMGHETVLAHLRKANREFIEDYQAFIDQSGLTPILIFDTIEAIRGTDTLTRLMIWIKKLPSTLIILSGRPVVEFEDPFVRELEEHPKLIYDDFLLSEFSREESLRYLEESPVVKRLEEEEKQRLALMSKGHPLWLALSIYYLREVGVPEEVGKLDIEANEVEWPYQDGALHDAYLRRLVIPYRKGDFWHKAVFRLGIVRRRVSKELWQELMNDQALPLDMPTWDEAWNTLLDFPWIRPRANEKYVTLQDALAEELARRIIPYRDFKKEQRRTMWRYAVEDYDRQIQEQQIIIKEIEKPLDKKLVELHSGEMPDNVLEEVLNLDKKKFELYLLQTTRIYYQMLYDYEAGIKKFIVLLDKAAKHHLIRFLELLWAEIQRFLPGEQVFDPLEDIINSEIRDFQTWYQNQPEIQFRIITRIAKYLYEVGQADQSERLLNTLWEVCQGNLKWEYEILRLRGNSRLRQSNSVKIAQDDFEQALERTRSPKAPSSVKLLEGQALMELGYFYRNVGDWSKAGERYLEALRKTPLEKDTALEQASIQSQYAYVQALRGLYQDAHELIDSALDIRLAMAEPRFIAMAFSVKGEVFRYERRYAKAWEAYIESEKIFSSLNTWGWLGLVRQEMAICLFQAYQAEVVFPDHDDLAAMLEHARELAEEALDYCREYSHRSYPSALNRAGRIFGNGFEEFDKGLKYLVEGIEEAKALADGWFWFANLIEYVELCYKAWEMSGNPKYLDLISERETEIKQVYAEYHFSDLRGRWHLLQGLRKSQFALQENVNDTEKRDLLQQAFFHFQNGYPLIAFGYVGSHGAGALRDEFGKLADVLRRLNAKTRVQWFVNLQDAWSQKTESVSKDRQESSLLALLNHLYLKLQIIPGKEKVQV